MIHTCGLEERYMCLKTGWTRWLRFSLVADVSHQCLQHALRMQGVTVECCLLPPDTRSSVQALLFRLEFMYRPTALLLPQMLRGCVDLCSEAAA